MRNKTAADVMTKPVVTIGPQESLLDALRVLVHHNISGLPVVDTNKCLVGIITEHDLMNFVFSGNAADTKVQEAMSPQVISFSTTTPLPSLVNEFAGRRIRIVPIVDQKKQVVGIVRRQDILLAMLSIYNRF